nr:hypothetical protein [Tanacetum cinerariifolium]
IRRRHYNLIPAQSKFKNLVLDHQDKYMMKAQISCDHESDGNDNSNKFCQMKGIKREFSVARTSQQNKAEAVNTACYVQNRVLVTKPHNKTPYELLIGRSPNLELMRPFGCPVTILNTLDHLGKFDGKADEGFLVRYFVNSKAFKVFNSRTRKVKENLHVNFLKNKPNVVSSRPEWLFDIDSLTKSMNYEPLTAGNQSNVNAGDVNTGDIQGDVDEISRNIDVCQGNEIRIDSSTQAVNADRSSINTANNIINAGSLNINTVDSNPTNMPTLEATSIFNGAFDDRDLGAEADTNKLDSSIVIVMKSAFLYGKIEEEVYVCQPPGFEDPDFPDKVQDKYVAEILKKFGFSEVKTASTLMETSKPLPKDEDRQETVVGNSTTKASKLYFPCVGFQTTSQLVINSPCLTDRKELASLRKMTTGKDFSNPLMDGRFLKTTMPTKLKKHKPKKKHTKEPEVPPTESQAKQNIPLPSPSHDPLPSGEDSLKLNELMDFCTNLSNKVIDLESEVIDIKSTYQARIKKLESRVDKLEEENWVLKELMDVHYKLDFDEPVMEKKESSKQGRKITDIDTDVLSMLDVNDEEPVDVEEVLEVVKVAKLITDVVITIEVDVNTANVYDTLITAVEEIKVSVLRKRRCVIIQYLEETTATVTVQPKDQTKDKGKSILIEEPKPLKRQAQIKLDEEVARQLEGNLNANVDWNAVIEQGISYDEIIPLFEKHYNYNQDFLNEVNKRVKVLEKEVSHEKEVEVESSKREGEILEQEIAKKQKMEQEIEEL